MWEPVEGYVISMPDDYMATSQPHLSLPISDEQYRSVLALVERWRKFSQPSYNLDFKKLRDVRKGNRHRTSVPASNDAKFIRDPRGFSGRLAVADFQDQPDRRDSKAGSEREYQNADGENGC